MTHLWTFKIYQCNYMEKQRRQTTCVCGIFFLSFPYFFHSWLCSVAHLPEVAQEGKAVHTLWLALWIYAGSRFEFKSFVLSESWSHSFILVFDHHRKLSQLDWDWGCCWKWPCSVVTIVCKILALPSNKGYLATDNLPVHLRKPLTLSGSHMQGSGVLLPFRVVALKPLHCPLLSL